MSLPRFAMWSCTLFAGIGILQREWWYAAYFTAWALVWCYIADRYDRENH